MKLNRVMLLVLLALTACAPACSKKQVKKTGPTEAEVAAQRAEEDRILKEKMTEYASQLDPVFFDYDSDSLGAEARMILWRNAKLLEGNASLTLIIEAHCDERGTVGYNLALGEKRAQSVKRYYMLLGVPEDRVRTVSYGEEKPACVVKITDEVRAEADREEVSAWEDECYGQNRRADTKLDGSLIKQ